MSQATEFFRLAGVWLGCRFDNLNAQDDKERMWRFLGEMDYHTEMTLLIRELLEGKAGGKSPAAFVLPRERARRGWPMNERRKS